MYTSITDDPHFRVADLTIGEVERILRDNDKMIKQLLGVVKEWFIPMMGYYSEEIWRAGWAVDLDSELPKFEPSVAIAAGLLGEIPFWDSSVEGDEDGFSPKPIFWKKYEAQQ